MELKESLPEVEKVLQAVRDKMAARGENVRQVAEIIGKNKQQVWDWLNKKKGTPTIKSLAKLKVYASLPDQTGAFK